MIGVLGDKETVVGFRMAGVKDCIETSEKNLREQLEKIKDKKIIIINEKFYKLLGHVDDIIMVPIPDKHGSIGIDDIKGMIKEIVGKEF